MTQITAILGKDADSDLIRKIIENVKGVIYTTVPTSTDGPGYDSVSEKNINIGNDKKKKIEQLSKLYSNINRSAIDLNDENTRYILSK